MRTRAFVTNSLYLATTYEPQSWRRADGWPTRGVFSVFGRPPDPVARGSERSEAAGGSGRERPAKPTGADGGRREEYTRAACVRRRRRHAVRARHKWRGTAWRSGERHGTDVRVGEPPACDATQCRLSQRVHVAVAIIFSILAARTRRGLRDANTVTASSHGTRTRTDVALRPFSSSSSRRRRVPRRISGLSHRARSLRVCTGMPRAWRNRRVARAFDPDVRSCARAAPREAHGVADVLRTRMPLADCTGTRPNDVWSILPRSGPYLSYGTCVIFTNRSLFARVSPVVRFFRWLIVRTVSRPYRVFSSSRIVFAFKNTFVRLSGRMSPYRRITTNPIRVYKMVFTIDFNFYRLIGNGFYDLIRPRGSLKQYTEIIRLWIYVYINIHISLD